MGEGCRKRKGTERKCCFPSTSRDIIICFGIRIKTYIDRGAFPSVLLLLLGLLLCHSVQE